MDQLERRALDKRTILSFRHGVDGGLTGPNFGRDEHCGALRDEEPPKGAGPRDASGQCGTLV